MWLSDDEGAYDNDEWPLNNNGSPLPDGPLAGLRASPLSPNGMMTTAGTPTISPLPEEETSSSSASSKPKELESAIGDPLSDSRLEGLRWFITWSQTPEDLQAPEIMTHLKAMGPTKKIIIAKEAHPETGGNHFHALVIFQKRLRARTGQMNPFYLRNQTIKCNVQLVKNVFAVETYVRKDGNVLEEGPQSPESAWQDILSVAVDESVESALLLLAEKRPRDFALHATSAEANLKRWRAMKTRPTPMCKPIESFTHAPRINPDWKVLIVAGRTGLGKTQWAKALMPGAPVLRHLDLLSEFDLSHGLVLDDIGVGHLPFTMILNLLDFEEDGHIHVRYRVAVIPAGTRRIFTTNHTTFTDWIYSGRDEKKMPVSPEHFEALGRRIVLINVYEKLFD